jgi:DNA polymerase V
MKEEIVLVIKEMAEHLAIRLSKGKKLAGGLSLWVRNSYQSNGPSIKLSCKIDPTQSTIVIQNEALRMFSSKYQGGPVREIGIGALTYQTRILSNLHSLKPCLDKQVHWSIREEQYDRRTRCRRRTVDRLYSEY